MSSLSAFSKYPNIDYAFQNGFYFAGRGFVEVKTVCIDDGEYSITTLLALPPEQRLTSLRWIICTS